MNVTRLNDPLLSYPIGSIYMSVNATSPDTLFGGTWERITGRFLLAATDGGAVNTNSNEWQAPGSMAGEAAHTLSIEEMPAHTHGAVGDHRHTDYHSSVNRGTGNTATRVGPYGYTTSGASGVTGGAAGAHEHASVGANWSHNNMPPFLAVYVWKRTA